MERKELKDLINGDYILVSSYSHDGFKLCKVEKITPKGFIKADGTLFDPIYGRERTSDIWRCRYCQVPTQEEINSILYVGKIRKLKAQIKTQLDFTENIDVLEKITEILGVNNGEK